MACEKATRQLMDSSVTYLEPRIHLETQWIWQSLITHVEETRTKTK